MKRTIGIAVFIFTLAFGAISASAQCNPNVDGAIRCGYYTEGYQDGVNDARSNMSNDYRRYRNKFESRYENVYRVAYEAGFASVRPTIRWTYSQRSAYDSGYTIGQNDRRSGGQGRASERSTSGYDPSIGQYFQQGYFDGFNNRPRQYDVPIASNPGWPGGGGGGANGTASWSGRVDGRANIYLAGNSIRSQDVSGTGLQIFNENIYGSIPRRPTTVNVNKRDGRGNVTVIQHPDRSNNFTAIVQIDDPRGGAGDYRLDISWASSAPVEEPYQSGSVIWRGRVDQTVNISINGSDVQTQDVSATGVSNVNFNINGYLAHRPGSVNVRRRSGRGSVTVLQQPTQYNDYTAVIQIFDAGGGADNYEIEINW